MTVSIRGKQYVTVAERVAAAHEDESAEFEITGSEIITIGETGRWWYQVTVLVRGRTFIGTAEIKFNAKAGTPDADNPVECAETSAVGRALAFAGIGSAEGIASADEVRRTGSGSCTLVDCGEYAKDHDIPPEMFRAATKKYRGQWDMLMGAMRGYVAERDANVEPHSLDLRERERTVAP